MWGAMKKNVALLILLALTDVFVAPGWAGRAAAPRPGASTAPGQIAAAGDDLIKLLPRSTIVVVVNDIKKIMEIDAVDKAMQDPKFKKGYDEFVQMSGIDLKRDVTYVGIGAPASEDASRLFMPSRESGIKNVAIVVNLKYDKARLQGLIKEKAPEAKEEMYNGVTVYSNLDDKGKPTTPDVLADVGKMSLQVAFLDASHIVLGSDSGVKGVIDVYRKKAEPLAKNSEMTPFLSRVDKSGIAWCAVSYPAELIRKAAGSNPRLKAFEGLKGLTMAIDDMNSTLVADIRTAGGTKEQNTAFASNLNGLKALGAMYAAQEPALGELLNGTAITSGKDYTLLTLTVSHETLGRLWSLVEPKGTGWQALFMEAENLSLAGDHERALEVGKQALDLAEKNLGPGHPDVAELLCDLARLYARTSQYAEAESFLKRSLAIREKALGPDHRDVADSLSVLALLYSAQRRFAEAEPLCRRALAIREKALGPDHLDVAQSLTDLAFLCYDKDRYAEAEPLFKRSLAIREKALGPDHLDVAEILDKLAFLYRTQGHLTEAEPLLKRALAIREKALGPDHPDVAASLGSLAKLCFVQGRFADAELHYTRSIAIREKALGPDHPDVAKSLTDLAELYRTQGRHTRAEPLLKRSLAIMEKALGPDDPQVATSLNDLAVFYYTWGRFAQAEPLFKRSLAIREKAFGPDHLDVARSLEKIAQLYQATNRQKEAEELWSRAARIRAIKR
jgi:tetratricopeptide (TPR) repeat protein